MDASRIHVQGFPGSSVVKNHHSEKHERHLTWKAGAIFFWAYNLCKDFEPDLM